MAVLDSGWPGNRRVVSLARNVLRPFFDPSWPQGNRDTATEPSWGAISTVSVNRGSSFPQTFANFTASALSDPDSIVTGISLIGNDLPAVSYDYATDTLTIASDPGAEFSESMQLRATTSAGSYDSPAFVVRDAASSGFVAQAGFSVSGTFSQGETITIQRSGGGFGTKPNGQKAVYVKLWEDGDTGTDANTALSRAPLSAAIVAPGTTVTSSPPSGVSNNALQHAFGDGSTSGVMRLNDVLGADKTFWFAKVRSNFDGLDAYAEAPGVWNIKWWRLRSAGLNNFFIPGFGQEPEADGRPRITAEYTDGSKFNAGHGIDLYKNQWRSEFVRFNQTSGSASDVYQILDGAGQEKRENFTTRDGAYPDRYKDIVFPQEQSMSVDAFRLWFSEFYLDDSWCFAVLTDSASYDETVPAKYEICPILAWSDSEIQIYFRPRAGLSHLHVMRNDGTTFYVGEAA